MVIFIFFFYFYFQLNYICNHHKRKFRKQKNGKWRPYLSSSFKLDHPGGIASNSIQPLAALKGGYQGPCLGNRWWIGTYNIKPIELTVDFSIDPNKVLYHISRRNSYMWTVGPRNPCRIQPKDQPWPPVIGHFIIGPQKNVFKRI